MVVVKHSNGKLYVVFSEQEMAEDMIERVYDMLIDGSHVSARICSFGAHENAIEIGHVENLADETIFRKLP